MTTITVKKDDSPKIYALLSDIYGAPLSLPSESIDSFKYSVYKIVSSKRIPVEGFTDVDIDLASCYHREPKQYPERISGINTSDMRLGYNVEVFPYRLTEVNDTPIWSSPFNVAGLQYEIDVTLRYYMTDVALSGSGYINKTFTVRVRVEA